MKPAPKHTTQELAGLLRQFTFFVAAGRVVALGSSADQFHRLYIRAERALKAAVARREVKPQ